MSLPLNCVQLILEYVLGSASLDWRYPDDFVQLLTVCKAWNDAIKGSIHSLTMKLAMGSMDFKPFVSLHTLSFDRNILRSINLGDIMRSIPSLKCLDLSVLHLGPVDAEAIASELKAGIGFSKLDLDNNAIGDHGAIEILQALKGSVTLETLSMKNCLLGEEAADELGRSIETFPNLQSIIWDFNEIGYMGAVTIANALRSNLSLTNLTMKNCDITGYAGLAFGDALKSNRSLLQLNLSENSLGDEGASNLAKSLATNSSLRSLVIGTNMIESIDPFESMLSSNVGLVSLDVSFNPIRDQGAAVIARGLRCNSTLIKLNLSNCKIENHGFMQLALSLASHPSVKSINVSVNKIEGRDGATAMMILSSPISKIEEVIFSRNKFDANELITIIEGMRLNPSLRSIEMKGYIEKIPIQLLGDVQLSLQNLKSGSRREIQIHF